LKYYHETFFELDQSNAPHLFSCGDRERERDPPLGDEDLDDELLDVDRDADDHDDDDRDRDRDRNRDTERPRRGGLERDRG